MIDYICFEVSSLCNMDCKFCFANWRDNREHIPYERVIEIIDKLKSYGVKAINLTGGEALLRSDIEDIVAYTKKIGMKTIISTNGIELMKHQGVLNYIDAINLPLDSYGSSIHNEMRPCAVFNHHDLILNLIDYINDFYPNVKIKINTMVGKTNLHDVINIGELLKGKVYSWKLGKFLSSGYGKNFDEMFSITDEEYESLLNEVNKKYHDTNIVEQEYKVNKDEIFNVFIDCYGHINIHDDNGIRSYEDFSELDKLINDGKIKELRREYLEKVYN